MLSGKALRMLYPELSRSLDKVRRKSTVTMLLRSLHNRAEDIGMKDCYDISACFLWRKTSQGRRYWATVHNECVANAVYFSSILTYS